MPAMADDAELIRVVRLLRQALGGIRILVHQGDALRRGDHAPDDETASTASD